MKVANVSWSATEDVTKINFSQEFLKSDWVVKADVLQDLLGMIEEEYMKVLDPNYPR